MNRRRGEGKEGRGKKTRLTNTSKTTAKKLCNHHLNIFSIRNWNSSEVMGISLQWR